MWWDGRSMYGVTGRKKGRSKEQTWEERQGLRQQLEALESERSHRTRALEGTEDPRLEEILHRVSYSRASAVASWEMSSAARLSLGLPEVSAWRRSSSRLRPSRC